MAIETNQSSNFSPTKPMCSSSCSCASGKGSSWRILGWAVIIALGIATIGGAFNRGSNSDGIAFQPDYAAAFSQAQADEKPLLLAFHASWCPPCNEMKNKTYKNRDVVDAAKDFIPVMIDVDEQKNLAAKYKIGPIPAWRVVTSDGSTIAAFNSYLHPIDYITKLKQALAQIN